MRDLLAELITQLAAVQVVKSSWTGNWDKGRAPLRPIREMQKMGRIVLTSLSQAILKREWEHVKKGV